MDATRSAVVPMLSIFSRAYWLLFGNLGLLLMAGLLLTEQPPLPSAYDLVFGGLVLSLGLARWVDVRFLGGQTAEDQPASGADLHRYWMRLFAGAALLWAIVRAIGLSS